MPSVAHHSDDHITFENVLPPSHRKLTKKDRLEDQSGLFFGDFCLSCGSPTTVDKAYCSINCQLNDCDLNAVEHPSPNAPVPGLASSRGSTPNSSTNSSPLGFNLGDVSFEPTRLELPPSVGKVYDYMYRLKPYEANAVEFIPEAIPSLDLKLHRPSRPSISLPHSIIASPRMKPAKLPVRALSSRRASVHWCSRPTEPIKNEIREDSDEVAKNHSAFAAVLFERLTSADDEPPLNGRIRSNSVGTEISPKRFIFGRHFVSQPTEPDERGRKTLRQEHSNIQRSSSPKSKSASRNRNASRWFS